MSKQEEWNLMVDKEYYKDLVAPDGNSLSIHHINWWLMKYEPEFYDAIIKSDCGKWSKWVKDNSIHVFPCVCPTREQDCIFIELYFELLRVYELETKEVFFGRILEEYKTVEKNEDAIALWLIKYKSIWQNSRFDEVIRIKLTTEPYTTLEIQLKEEEFINIATFKNVYSGHHYSLQ